MRRQDRVQSKSGIAHQSHPDTMSTAGGAEVKVGRGRAKRIAYSVLRLPDTIADGLPQSHRVKVIGWIPAPNGGESRAATRERSAQEIVGRIPVSKPTAEKFGKHRLVLQFGEVRGRRSGIV